MRWQKWRRASQLTETSRHRWEESVTFHVKHFLTTPGKSCCVPRVYHFFLRLFCRSSLLTPGQSYEINKRHKSDPSLISIQNMYILRISVPPKNRPILTSLFWYIPSYWIRNNSCITASMSIYLIFLGLNPCPFFCPLGYMGTTNPYRKNQNDWKHLLTGCNRIYKLLVLYVSLEV